MIKTKDIMTRNLIVVDPDYSLQMIEHLMKANNINHMLVAENMILKGVISDGDIRRLKHPDADSKSASTKAEQSLYIKASKMMSKKVVAIGPEKSVKDAIDIFLQGRYHCLPVVESGNKLIGVITSTDILLYSRRFF